jgi:hypothetical protein
MDLWMKSVWVLAALTIIACLVALGGASGGGTVPVSATTPTTMEYFTARDPARATVDYGVREGQQTVIYNSHPASAAP